MMTDHTLNGWQPNEPEDRDAIVPRHNHQATAEALFSLSQTQRQLAHRATLEAASAEAEGNLRWYIYWEGERRRLWKSAFWHLAWAREEFYL